MQVKRENKAAGKLDYASHAPFQPDYFCLLWAFDDTILKQKCIILSILSKLLIAKNVQYLPKHARRKFTELFLAVDFARAEKVMIGAPPRAKVVQSI